jgi:hypothetical protein
MSIEAPDELVSLAERHASGMVDAYELYKLAENIRRSVSGETFTGVEIGAYVGSTTVFALKFLRRLGVKARWIVIDPFELFEADPLNPQGVSKEFIDRIRTNGFNDNVVAVVATSERALPFIPPAFDFLFIDGFHSYEVCKFDLDNYASRLRPGGGLFVDDYSDAYPGVMKACDEFLCSNPGFQIIEKAWFLDAKRGPENAFIDCTSGEAKLENASVLHVA